MRKMKDTEEVPEWPLRWVTLKKAAELTGLNSKYLHEHTGSGGDWPEGKVWKWFEGRKLIDLAALYAFIDQKIGVASRRGQRSNPSV